MSDMKPAAKKGRPTFEAQLKKMGFGNVEIDRADGIKTLMADYKGQIVTMRAYAGDDLIEIAKGWLEHQL